MLKTRKKSHSDTSLSVKPSLYVIDEYDGLLFKNIELMRTIDKLTQRISRLNQEIATQNLIINQYEIIYGKRLNVNIPSVFIVTPPFDEHLH